MALRIVKIILIVIWVLNFSTTVFAQRQKTRRANQAARILKDKPTVYITFETFGKLEPIGIDESKDGVYLRLHNNTRWSLVLSAGGFDSEMDATGKEVEVGLFYGFEEISTPLSRSGSEFFAPRDPREASRMTELSYIEAHKYDKCEVQSNESCRFCSAIQLQPGKSFLFSLPREELCQNLKTYISYQYDWEDDWGFGNEPRHRVYFSGADLPKKSDKK